MDSIISVASLLSTSIATSELSLMIFIRKKSRISSNKEKVNKRFCEGAQWVHYVDRLLVGSGGREEWFTAVKHERR